MIIYSGGHRKVRKFVDRFISPFLVIRMYRRGLDGRVNEGCVFVRREGVCFLETRKRELFNESLLHVCGTY